MDKRGELRKRKRRDNPDVDQAICEEARAAGIPADVPGSPELCDFYLPALLRRVAVVVGVGCRSERLPLHQIPI